MTTRTRLNEAAEVVPFDLDATTHVVTDTDDGGIQVVTADDQVSNARSTSSANT